MIFKNKFLLFVGVFLLWGCSSGTINQPQPSPEIPTENTGTQIPGETSPQINEYKGTDTTNLNLKVPDNFTISLWSDDLKGARDMVGPDIKGNYRLSRTSEGIITLLEVQNLEVVKKTDILKNLKSPHGLALSPDGSTLYFAQTDSLFKKQLYSTNPAEKMIDLPAGGRHFTRSLLFGPDDKIYISIGSTCDTCYEKDEKIGTIYKINPDGTGFEKVASGLRNSVFMAINPITGVIWATEMGRDNLGDNIPPDEINIIQNGKDYGWPLCYGQNIPDTTFEKQSNSGTCLNKTPPHIELPAHSAPLGLAFIPEEGWPEGYGNNLLVAYHGSWNRSEPTGYKIAYIELDKNGKLIRISDFISGWLQEKSGRVVDILPQPGGIAYITDDKLGVIYKLTYNNPDFSSVDKKDFTDPENKIEGHIQVDSRNHISITGNASGTWYFEAVFGVKLVDENNTLLSQGQLQAHGDWMTEGYVPFSGSLDYKDPLTSYGYLIFSKANPSGLPEKEFEKRIQIKLK